MTQINHTLPSLLFRKSKRLLPMTSADIRVVLMVNLFMCRRPVGSFFIDADVKGNEL